MTTSRGRIAELVVIVITLGGVGGCRDATPTTSTPKAEPATKLVTQLPAPRPSAFVGMQACVECHAELVERYQRHPMGRSAGLLKELPVIESPSETPISALGGFSYQVEAHDKTQLHHERLLAVDGTPLYDQAVEMELVVGSGRRGRSYLARRGPYLTMSPITWYSRRKVWDLSPGFASMNRHYERRTIDGCLQCHIGRVATGPQTDMVAQPLFHEAVIGCERCHGPGEEHIAWRKTHAAAGSAPDDPIVNPSHLAPTAREAVCHQCHLQGVERVLRYGRSEYDFRPGDELSAVWVIQSQGMADSASAVHQVPQFQSSRCFLASNGKMGCTSCHDPHEAPEPENAVAYYRSRCLECHSTATACSLPENERRARQADDSCIACHMPPIAASDIPHTAQSDHRILRRPETQPLKSLHERQPFKLWPGMEQQLPAAELIRARGLLMARYARDEKDVVLAIAAADVLERLTPVPDDHDLWFALGDLYDLQQRPGIAEDYWRRGLQAQPDNQRLLRSLGILLHQEQREAEAVEVLQRCVAVDPTDRVVAGRLVHLLGRMNRVPEALALAERTVAEFPWDRQIQDWLANAYAAAGRTKDAAAKRAIVERLRSDP